MEERGNMDDRFILFRSTSHSCLLIIIITGFIINLISFGVILNIANDISNVKLEVDISRNVGFHGNIGGTSKWQRIQENSNGTKHGSGNGYNIDKLFLDDTTGGEDDHDVRMRYRRGAGDSRRRKVMRFEMDNNDHDNCTSNCQLKAFNSGDPIGDWYFPSSDRSAERNLNIEFLGGNKKEVVVKSRRGFYYIFAYITFGPTMGDYCHETGFSIRIRGREVAKTISRIPLTDLSKLDCPSYSGSQQLSLVVELTGSHDVITLHTLYPGLTVWKRTEYTYWGIIQL